MILFAFRWWKEIALVAVLAGIYGYHWNAIRQAKNEGFALCEARASADVDRRIKNALEAERNLSGGNAGKRLHDDDGLRRDE